MPDRDKHNPVIGCGTGRCGTRSLAQLLSNQGLAVTHERRPRLPWRFDRDAADRRVAELSGGSGIDGDVGLYYLPYIEYMLKRLPSLRVIVMERPKDEVVDSFRRWLAHRPGINHWTIYRENVLDDEWDRHFPDLALTDFSECVARYWQVYRIWAELLESRHPQVRRFATDSMNHPEGIRAILGHAGAPRRDLRAIRINVGRY